MSPVVTTRRRCPADERLVRDLYVSTRLVELAGLGWSEEAVGGFLDLQFRAHEQAVPDGADDLVVEVDGRPAGRMVVDRTGHSLRLVDVALLPSERSLGVGSRLVADLCDEADAVGRPIDLHVLVGSPAVRLYRRHGFDVAGKHGPHVRMHRSPKAPSTSAPEAPAGRRFPGSNDAPRSNDALKSNGAPDSNDVAGSKDIPEPSDAPAKNYATAPNHATPNHRTVRRHSSAGATPSTREDLDG